ncbi:hypothetical protein [Paraoerskovia sediminicola]|uniref:hypothetical protein n=1 Tax=Paraoerskovia sediminicola TaxID=1138587 RepID=UPI0025734240|nr:hypothetical protein [Paraoerskovia sediminicola]
MAAAVVQIAKTGSPSQVAVAGELLEKARQDLYLVLAQPAERDAETRDGDAE